MDHDTVQLLAVSSDFVEGCSFPVGCVQSRRLEEGTMSPLVRIAAIVVLLGIAILGLWSPSEQVLLSSLDREAHPDTSEGEVASVAAGNTRFAFGLYEVVREKDGNVLFSPYSITLAMAMIRVGAQGETERQLAEGLHFTLSQVRFHPALNALSQTLDADDHDPFELRIANALWGQTGYPFRKEFLDTLAVHYGAGLRLIDFEDDPEQARVAINRWIDRTTNGRIPGALPRGSVGSDARFVLCNAIYFNAEWRLQFARQLTADELFHLGSGESVLVPMMRHDGPRMLRYAKGTGYQAVELPYKGDRVSMIVLLPDEGEGVAFERALDVARWEEITTALSVREVKLVMPKFRYADSVLLAGPLGALGMTDVFDSSAANLAGISEKPLFLQTAFHQAFIDVNEERTEAAASTVLVGAEPALEELVQVIVDRPFVFVIRERSTGTILFMGRVMDPRVAG
jgi:serpin B